MKPVATGENAMVAPVMESKIGRQLGPGLRAALTVLGPAGEEITRCWSKADTTALLVNETELEAELDKPSGVAQDGARR
jgi:hypothetical protein